jgi:HK97 family phage prohead protease
MAEEISGYAALFGVETVIAGLFRERIAPGAFRDTIARDDVRASFNHNLDQLLGRKSAGTLRLSEDVRGLRYVITINDKDPVAIGVAAKIARRDVSGSSFWFEPVSDDDEQWERGASGQLPLRTLLKVKLIEAGPVALPAYAQTTVSVSDTRSPEALALPRSETGGRLTLDGCGGAARDDSAMVGDHNISQTSTYLRLTLDGCGGAARDDSAMVGDHNISQTSTYLAATGGGDAEAMAAFDRAMGRTSASPQQVSQSASSDHAALAAETLSGAIH